MINRDEFQRKKCQLIKSKIRFGKKMKVSK